MQSYLLLRNLQLFSQSQSKKTGNCIIFTISSNDSIAFLRYFAGFVDTKCLKIRNTPENSDVTD